MLTVLALAYTFFADGKGRNPKYVRVFTKNADAYSISILTMRARHLF
jgi:hypothetical protein